jgi:CheY-like chemotaxis protein
LVGIASALLKVSRAAALPTSAARWNAVTRSVEHGSNKCRMPGQCKPMIHQMSRRVAVGHTQSAMNVERRPRTDPRIRLLIADDRERTRSATGALLSGHPGLEVVGEASDGQQAVDRIDQLAPDMVILDVRMPRLDGIATTAEIKRRWPRVRVVVHSLAVDRRDDALGAGADAFVEKAGRPDELLEALRL